MSRRVGAGGRGKAKKDDLAKAAAEVLNNINITSPPAVAAPAISGGLLQQAFEERDAGADVQSKQPQALSDQEVPAPGPPPASVEQRFTTFPSSRHKTPPSIHLTSPGLPGGGTHGGDDDAVGGEGAAGGKPTAADGDGGGKGGLGSEPAATNPLPGIPIHPAAPAARPQGPTSALTAATAAAAVGVQTLFARARALTQRAAGTAAAAITTVQLDHDDVAAADAPAGAITVTVNTRLAAAAVLLLLSLLGLSAAGYRLAAAASRAQEPLRGDVRELQRQLLDWREQAEAAAGEVQEQIRGARLADQRLGRQLAGLGADLEAALAAAVRKQEAEVRALRQALEARDAVRSIVSDGGDGGAAAMVTASSVVEAVVGLEAATADGGGGDGRGRGLDLRGLPACHSRRLEAAAGPLLPSRVSGHSVVVGDEESLMRFHSALSAVFAPERSAPVHPLARQLTSFVAEPVCLPLAAAAGTPFLELTLAAPANVSAVSVRYPAYGTWDTSSALLRLSATLHEAPASSDGGGGGSGGGGGAGDGGLQRGLRTRRVQLPPLRGVECQHVPIPPAPPAGPYDSGPMLVYGITLHVHENFGNHEQTCMPRVLVHGRGG